MISATEVVVNLIFTKHILEIVSILTFPEIRRISGNVSILVGLSPENAKDKFNWLLSE